MSRKQQFKVTKELEGKCDAPGQFERFDSLFRKVISVTKPAADKEEARYQRRRNRHSSKSRLEF